MKDVDKLSAAVDMQNLESIAAKIDTKKPNL